MVKFSNRRLVAEFSDWPIGGSSRGMCRFAVESNKRRGTRVSRTTTDKNGRWCKPKYTTYSDAAVIVDGDDGKTYVLSYSALYGFVRVWRSDFLSAERDVIREGDADFAEVLELIFPRRSRG